MRNYISQTPTLLKIRMVEPIDRMMMYLTSQPHPVLQPNFTQFFKIDDSGQIVPDDISRGDVVVRFDTIYYLDGIYYWDVWYPEDDITNVIYSLDQDQLLILLHLAFRHCMEILDEDTMVDLLAYT